MSSPPTSPRSRLYQIDFTAVQTGKHIASTKRRVRWRFGFANAQALARGLTGQACRGSEHEVTFLWSVTSGKCVVMADGQEVHYSTSRSSVFDYSWTMKGNHILKIVAHAAPPLSQTPNFRQYDLFVNGQSFFTFPKVFRLGLAPGQVPSVTSGGLSAGLAERGERRRSTDITNLEAPHNPDEEEAYLQEAIRQSLQDDDGAGGKKLKASTKAGGGSGSGAQGTADLLDFGPSSSELALSPAPAPPTAVASYPPPQQQQQPQPPQNAYSYGGVSAYRAPGPPPTAATTDPFGYASSTSSLPALPASTSTYGAATATATATTGPPAGGDPWANSSMASLPPTTSGYGDAPAPSTNSYGGPANASGALSTSLVPAAPSQAPMSPWAQPTVPQHQQPPPQPYAPPGAYSSSATWPNPAPAGGPAATTAYNPQGQPPPQHQYAMPTAAAPPPASSWTAPPPVQTGYGGSANPFGGAPRIDTADPSARQGLFGASSSSSSVPTTVTPHAQPTTPSTIGFMSPAAPSTDFAGFGSPEPTNPSGGEGGNNPALFSMSSLASFDVPAQNGNAAAADMNGAAVANGGFALASTSTSLADQAYSKLVNMDTFSLVSKNDAPRSNPFDVSAMSSTIGGSQSLADIQAKKASSSSGSAKPVMNTPMPAPGAMVMSSNQNGAYGASYGVQSQPPSQYYAGAMGMGQGQPSPPYGQNATPTQPSMAGPIAHLPQYGQPFADTPTFAYGQASYSAGPVPPARPPAMMAQPSYGAYGASPPQTQGFY